MTALHNLKKSLGVESGEEISSSAVVGGVSPKTSIHPAEGKLRNKMNSLLLPHPLIPLLPSPNLPKANSYP
jgi:hypothetical protein